MKWMAAVMVMSVGCSIGLPTPSTPHARPPACNDSYALPILDTLGAITGLMIGGLGTGVAVFAGPTLENKDNNAILYASVPILVAGVVYALSAVHGYGVVGACLGP